MTITLLSSDPKFDEIYLSNYATLNVLDMLRRVPGVGSVSNVGSRYLKNIFTNRYFKCGFIINKSVFK